MGGFKVKIEQLPSGSYRMRKMFKGKVYTIILPYKPTQNEANNLILEEIRKAPKTKVENITFRDAAKSYVAMKQNTLSPSTARYYNELIKTLPDNFLNKSVGNINFIDVQKLVNDMASECSAKTVQNKFSFIRSVLWVYNPELKIDRVTKPQKKPKEVFVPQDADIKKMISELKGTEYEIPFRLECYGLRRSEVCALTIDDVHGNFVKVNKAKIKNPDHKWIIKDMPKTDASIREIYIDDELAEMIRAKGAIYNGSPNSLAKPYDKAERNAGIEHFSQHKLRHYFASKMISEGFDMETIKKMGGWKTSRTIERVYAHVMRDKLVERQKAAAAIISSVTNIS